MTQGKKNKTGNVTQCRSSLQALRDKSRQPASPLCRCLSLVDERGSFQTAEEVVLDKYLTVHEPFDNTGVLSMD